MVVALVLFDETLSTSNRPAVAILWGSLSLTAYAAGLMCLISTSRRCTDLGITRWKIGPWTLLWYGIAFGLTTVTVRVPQSPEGAEVALTSVLRALWLVAVGMTMVAVGYLVGPGQLIGDLAARGIDRVCARFDAQLRGPAAPWGLFAVGFAASLVVTVTTGRLGYVGITSPINTTAYGGILGAVSQCAPLAIAAAALQVFRERLPGARITLTILLLSYLAFGALTGNKSNFVLAALAVVVPFSAARRRLPIVALIVFVLVFLAIVIPFNLAYRHAANKGSLTPNQAVAAAPGILRQTVDTQSLAAVLLNSIGFLGQRIPEIDNPAIIMQRAPSQVPFRSPVQLIEAPIAGWVPRGIWPGKPIYLTGAEVTQEFYEMPPTSASADTMVGGLYWYGGWLPLVFGMLLLGGGMRLLDDTLDVRKNPHAIFLVLLLFQSLVGSETDWNLLLAGIPATMFVWLLAVALVFRKRKRT